MKSIRKKGSLGYYRWMREKLKKCARFKNSSEHSQEEQDAQQVHEKQDISNKEITETKFIKKIVNQNVPQKTPIKILLSSEPQFTYPQQIIVRVSKQTQNGQFQEIDYKSNDNKVVYLKVNTQEFLEDKHDLRISGDSRERFSVSVPQMKLQSENYEVPEIVSKYLDQVKGDLYAVNLWHYRKEAVTKWHYDAHDNFLFQVKGRKEVSLHPPNTPKQMAVALNHQKNEQNENINGSSPYIRCDSIFSMDNNHVREDDLDQNSDKNTSESLESSSSCFTITIDENECLFIPRGWFHRVKSYTDEKGDNVAVSFWGNTVEAYNLKKEELEINLKQMILNVSEEICKESMKEWKELNEEMKEQFRKAYFMKFLNKIS